MKEKVSKLIKDYVGNYHAEHHTVTQWEEPLIAFARAADPLFLQLKEKISPTHLLPTDLLEDAQTVIAFYLPFAREINFSNQEREESSESWARAYLETNQLIVDLNIFMNEQFTAMNYQSSKLPPTHNFDQEKLISDWSHKHVANIAGLGKFGLHRMLITEKGCSGRIGSIVTNLAIEPTTRPEQEFCLYMHNKTCAQCVQKCVNGALQVDSYDRRKCYESLLRNAAKYAELGLADVCGKCITAVPCAFVNPCKLTKPKQ